MSRPPRARERVLDAFAAILIGEGERAATLDATAKAAGVSKGGLLYHFGSREELTLGLLERLQELANEDLARMSAAPDGRVRYFLRTSVMEDASLDRALVAVSRLAQGGHHAASEALRAIRESWAQSLRPHVRDQAALDLILLLGDGLYYNNALDASGNKANALAATVPTGTDLEALISLAVRASVE